MSFFRLQGGFCFPGCVTSAGVFVATQPPTAYQKPPASMVGTVTDPSGAAVPDATVTLVNTSTGSKYNETTNGVGFYRFANIPPGQGYEATFTAKGFAA